MKYYLLIILITSNLYSQEYIQIKKPDINIRMLPSTSSPIIGHAFYNEIYILNGEESKWYSVLLPSGETRWIYKSLANKIVLKDSLEANIDLLKIQEELELASDRANKDANQEEIRNLNKIEINNILFDRYSLIVLQDYNISPVFYQNIINYVEKKKYSIRKNVAEYMLSVSHIDYDLFKIDALNFYIETRRCFKLGTSLDAMIFMYYEREQFVQKLCFEDGYGQGFDNCYDIKNIYSAVLEEPNLVVITQGGKLKKTNLVLKEATLDLSH